MIGQLDPLSVDANGNASKEAGNQAGLCSCPFTLRNGHYEITRFLESCPEHGMITAWMGEERMQRILDYASGKVEDDGKG